MMTMSSEQIKETTRYKQIYKNTRIVQNSVGVYRVQYLANSSYGKTLFKRSWPFVFHKLDVFWFDVKIFGKPCNHNHLEQAEENRSLYVIREVRAEGPWHVV